MKKTKTKVKLTKENITLDDIVAQSLGIVIEVLSKSKSENLSLKCEFNIKKDKYNVDLTINKVNE